MCGSSTPITSYQDFMNKITTPIYGVGAKTRLPLLGGIDPAAPVGLQTHNPADGWFSAYSSAVTEALNLNVARPTYRDLISQYVQLGRALGVDKADPNTNMNTIWANYVAQLKAMALSAGLTVTVQGDTTPDTAYQDFLDQPENTLPSPYLRASFKDVSGFDRVEFVYSQDGTETIVIEEPVAWYQNGYKHTIVDRDGNVFLMKELHDTAVDWFTEPEDEDDD